MKDERYKELSENKLAVISEAERREGWHFCRDWDFMLIGSNMKEWEFCDCAFKKGIKSE